MSPLLDRHRRVRAQPQVSAQPRLSAQPQLSAQPRTSFDTVAVTVLLVLAWVRLPLPTLWQLLSTGRPPFNSRADLVPPLGEAVATACSLGVILVAAVLVIRGLTERIRTRVRCRTQKTAELPTAPTALTAPTAVTAPTAPTAPMELTVPAAPTAWTAPTARAVTGRRVRELARIGVVLAPLVAIQVSALVNHEPLSAVALAFPLAAIALWLRPPAPGVLAVFGGLTVLTAAGSMLLAALRPDLGLLSGATAGAKDGFLGGLLAGPYLHSNVLGLVLALQLPFVLAIANAVTRWCGLVIVLSALLWTGSRSSELAAVIVVLAYLLIRRYPTRTWPVSALLAVGVALIVAVPLVTTDPDGFTRRGRIWTTLLHRWLDQPVLGFGPDYLDNQPQLAKELGGQFTHGHNVMVQLLLVGGLLAAVLFAVLLFATWRRSVLLSRAGITTAALFLIAFAFSSWLEASHITTTLAGSAVWLPLIVINTLAVARPAEPDAQFEPHADSGPDNHGEPGTETGPESAELAG